MTHNNACFTYVRVSGPEQKGRSWHDRRIIFTFRKYFREQRKLAGRKERENT
jgi:hypothetical protein